MFHTFHGALRKAKNNSNTIIVWLALNYKGAFLANLFSGIPKKLWASSTVCNDSYCSECKITLFQRRTRLLLSSLLTSRSPATSANSTALMLSHVHHIKLVVSTIMLFRQRLQRH